MVIDVDLLLSALKQGLPIAKMLAGLTKTQWDDMAVQLIEAAANSPEIAALLRLAFNDPEVIVTVGDSARSSAIRSALSKHSAHEGVAAAEKAGIPWALILEYGPMVYALVLQILGRRK